MKRNTKQREEVWKALEATPEFVSAQELHLKLRGVGSTIGLATVYRTLNSLAEEGSADALSIEGENLFRACSPGHHHHLICRACGATTEIEAGEVEVWARKTAGDHGYSNPQHIVDIFGTCPPCQSGLAPSA
ncbi:MAG: transcriptional repressor [Microbacteriaceae bacterium]|jgi:Fur family transcriptional regulator, ferric uptake regulator|nr:transcriptional repressor [Microbacteriaceae bacterium]